MFNPFAKTTLACVSLFLPLAAAAAAPGALSYVQDGLIAQWDGIDNAGTGTRDAAATEWVDLKGGGGNLPLSGQTTNSWNDAGYLYLKPGGITTPNKFTLDDLTIEIFANSYGNTFRRFEAVPWTGRMESWSTSEGFLERITTTRLNVGAQAFNADFAFVTTYRNKTHVARRYKDGVLQTSRSGTGDNATSVANWPLAFLKSAASGAHIYSIRIYNRALSDEEIALNVNLDQVRFNNADPEAFVWPDGYRATNGVMQFRHTVSTGVAGTTVSVNGAAEAWCDVGATVSVSATGPYGYTFLGWTGDVDGLTNDLTVATMTFPSARPRALTALFRIPVPGITNAGGATNVTAGSAWLNGMLVDTGVSATAVSAYWGKTDGGTNAGAWAESRHWPAPQELGGFTVQATGLDADSAYFYRFAASNEAGVAWAESSSGFITGDVWIEKTADASETGPAPGTFAVRRAGSAAGCALTVFYTVEGTATPGADYAPLDGALAIPAGATSATLTVTPVVDCRIEGPETVTVTLAPGPYITGETSAAELEIADNERMLPANSYVQDGLIAQWDGIDNAGAGVHDPDATDWAELKGGLETTATALAFRDGNCAYFNGIDTSGTVLSGDLPAALEAISKGAFTAEVRFTPLVYKQYAGLFHFGVWGSTRYFSLTEDLHASSGQPSFIGAFQYKRSSWNAANCYSLAIATLNVPTNVSAVADGPSHKLYLGDSLVSTLSAGPYTAYESTAFQFGRYATGNAGRARMNCYAIRLYDRVLSAGEIAVNANLDRIRFEGEDPAALAWPDGYRLTNGVIETRVRVVCEAAAGTVSVNGGEAASGTNDTWIAITNTSPVSVTATPADGKEFAIWLGDVDGLTLAERKNPQLAVAAGRHRTLTAVFRPEGSGIHYIPDDFASISEALAADNVYDGDTIYLRDGTYMFEQVKDEATGYWCLGAVRKGVAVTSGGRTNAVLDCATAGGLIIDHKDAVLSNVSIRNFHSKTNSPALHLLNGVASNIYVNGSVAAGMHAGSPYVVYVGPGGLVTDSDFHNLRKTAWDSSTIMQVTGGTVRRTTIRNFESNCRALRSWAGGAKRARFENCTIAGNFCYYVVGIDASGTDLADCVFRNNWCSDQQPGMGLFGNTTLTRCVITNNAAGGTCPLITCGTDSTACMTNCLVANNTISQYGVFKLAGKNAKLDLCNVTVAHNKTTSSSYAGGITGDGASAGQAVVRMRNTILRNNTANNIEKNFLDSYAYTDFHFANCCLTGIAPVPGEGNVDGDPAFADAAGGDFRLGKGSSCIDAGADTPEVAIDLDFKERPVDGIGDGTAEWDIGCYEADAPDIPLESTLITYGTGEPWPCTATQSVNVAGSRLTGLAYEWWAIRDAGGVLSTNVQHTDTPANAFTGLEPGMYSFVCIVRNDQGNASTNFAENAFRATVDTCYVSGTGSDTWPYTNAAAAARQFSAAAENAARRIVVAPGAYAFGHVTDPATGLDCVGAVRRAVAIEGAENPEDLVIDCSGLGGIILDHADAFLHGVTLRNFLTAAGTGPALYVRSGTASNLVVCGSGTPARAGKCVYVGEKSLVTDLVVTNYMSTSSGDYRAVHLYGGTLRNALVRDCETRSDAVYAEGSSGGTRSRVENCMLLDNRTTSCSTLALSSADAAGCTISGNVCVDNANSCVRLHAATLTDCSLTRNSGQGTVYVNTFWGTYWHTLRNCLVADNTNTVFAAVCAPYWATMVRLESCTVARNASGSAGAGGVHGGAHPDHRVYVTLLNSVVWGNTTNGLPSDVSGIANIRDYSHSCFREAGDYPGKSNLAADPLLLRGCLLSGYSPCRDAGLARDWHAAGHDLAGKPRLQDKGVDMGCYECPPPRSLLIILH